MAYYKSSFFKLTLNLMLVALLVMSRVTLSWSSDDEKSRINATEFENMLCGPISLSLAIRLVGVDCSGYVLAKQLNVSEKGVTMEELGQAALRAGVQAVPYKLRNTNDLLQLNIQTPGIVLLRHNHFAVVWSAGDGHIWLADYPNNIKKVSHTQLINEQWNPNVLVISRLGTASPFTRSNNMILWLIASLTIGLLFIYAYYYKHKVSSL